MAMPYRIATLLYCFNDQEEVLLLKRKKQPNLGLWSPCGGKLETGVGESPHACACREAVEEMGVDITHSDLHLTGLVSEHGYEGSAHWLMFLFEIKPRLRFLPKSSHEGVFGFFARESIEKLEIPVTDREQLWPLFWAHRRGFFAAHCRAGLDGRNEWTIEESRSVGWDHW